jgi:hypothetical protein
VGVKRKITVTYKNGETETHDFKAVYFWKHWAEITLKDKEKDIVCVELAKLKEMTIK